jgi:hypothetical protein
MRPAACLLLLTLGSCERLGARSLGAPTRIVTGRADTIVVNSVHRVTLPIQVLDDAGHALPLQKISVERISGDALDLSATGQVTCKQRGDAVVRVALGALARRFKLLCRPIKGFRFVYSATRPFVVGDAPRALEFAAVGVDDRPERVLAGTLSIGDSSVAELRGLTVRPLSPGATMAELDLGECFWAMAVTVNERVESPAALRTDNDVFLVAPLRLVDGERRGWRLPRGEYRVGLLTQANVDTQLLLGRTAMNCVPWITGGQNYHCIALAGASIDVRNPRRAGAGGELYGELFVQRFDLPQAARAVPALARRRPRKRMCPMVR